MATSTTRLGLRKPDPDPLTGDFVDAQADLNDNWDNIDGKLPLIVCTSGTRPGTPYQGMQIFETDTDNVLFWDGGNWMRLFAQGQDVGWPETMLVKQSSTSAQVLRSEVTGESFPRWTMQQDGLMGWSPGSATYDTFLSRSGVGILTATGLVTTNDMTVGRGLYLPGRKRKTADTSKTSDATPATDPHLVVAMEASKAYSIHGCILLTSPTAADIKCQFTGPAGLTFRVCWETWSKATAVGTQLADSRMTIEGEAAAIPTGGSTFSTQSNWIIISGVIVSGTAGNLNFQWSQNTSTASATTVYANSWIELIPFA